MHQIEKLMIREGEWSIPRCAGAFGTPAPTLAMGRSLRPATWDRAGVEALVSRAAKEIPGLPWNLATHGPWVSYSHNGHHSLQGNEAGMVETAARFAGWLRSLAGMPGGKKLLERTQSPRGILSNRTTVNLWDLFDVCPSPGRLERALWAVKEGANRRLGEMGQSPNVSWAAVAHALIGRGRNGKPALRCRRKAAVVAAAGHLSGKRLSFRQGRAWLADFQAMRETTDETGTTWRESGDLLYMKHGIVVLLGLILSRKRQWEDVRIVYGPGGRVWHSWGWLRDPGWTRLAVRDAIRGWRQQKEMKSENKDIFQFLARDDFTPLVYFSDSLAAGNCDPGTRQWMANHGWQGRNWVPAPWLAPYMGEERVANAVRMAASKTEGEG